jgi:hypothetical protein
MMRDRQRRWDEDAKECLATWEATSAAALAQLQQTLDEAQCPKAVPAPCRDAHSQTEVVVPPTVAPSLAAPPPVAPTLRDEKPRASIDEKPRASIDEKPRASIDEEPRASIDEKSPASIDEALLAPLSCADMDESVTLPRMSMQPAQPAQKRARPPAKPRGVAAASAAALAAASAALAS